MTYEFEDCRAASDFDEDVWVAGPEDHVMDLLMVVQLMDSIRTAWTTQWLANLLGISII